jgi:hypothetical protein
MTSSDTVIAITWHPYRGVATARSCAGAFDLNHVGMIGLFVVDPVVKVSRVNSDFIRKGRPANKRDP